MSQSTAVRRTAASVAVVLLTLHLHARQALVASAGSQPPPGELAPPVAALLAEGSASVKADEVPLVFWWVQAVPLEQAPSSTVTWRDVADGAVVGVVRVGAAWRDIRGFVVKPGVYTLRYALQPANGDHLGISPYREFLLLCPAELDTTPDPVGYKGAVDLSKRTVHRAHPSALSLVPPSTANAPLSTVTGDLGLQGVVFSVPVSFGGKAAGTLTFGLILSGTIES
jgi:hypothetical protein